MGPPPYRKQGNFGGRGRGRGGAPYGQHNGQRGNDRSGGGRGGFHHGGDRGRGNGKRGGGNQASTADFMKTLLALLVEKTYGQIFTEESGMLRLVKMRDADDLKAVKGSVDFHSVSFCKSLCEVLREKFENRISIIQIDDNQISKLPVFLDALINADLHEGITALSVQNNQIEGFGFLGSLRKFSRLNELVLLGNPVTKEPNYAREVSRRLPVLNLLDGNTCQRNLLSLPSPVWVSMSPDQEGILQFLKDNLLFPMMNRNFESLLGLYNSQAIYTVSASNQRPPFPHQIPLQAKNNTEGFPMELCRVMKGDFSRLRGKIQWRSVMQDPGVPRGVTSGKPEVIVKIKDFCASFLPIFIEMTTTCSNVEFLSSESEPWMSVPLCLATLHGNIRYYWKPSQSADSNIKTLPFISCFFDRTLSLTISADNVWTICNDMVHLRPDYVVSQDGHPADPVFFSFAPERLERLRRRLFPEVSIEILRAIIQEMTNLGIPSSDFNLQQLILRIKSAPSEEVSAALTSPDSLSSFIGRISKQ